MSNEIHTIWAKFPTFLKENTEASNDASIIFLDFIPPLLFQKIKHHWMGDVFYHNQKKSTYHIDVLKELLQETYTINLNGITLPFQIQTIPGTNLVNKIINFHQNNSHPIISPMSDKQKNFFIYQQIKNDLWDLFRHGKTFNQKNFEEKNKFFQSNIWTEITPYKYEKNYFFDLTHGFIYFNENCLYKLFPLKTKENLPKFIHLVYELKNYGKKLNTCCDFQFTSIWADGFKQ